MKKKHLLISLSVVVLIVAIPLLQDPLIFKDIVFEITETVKNTLNPDREVEVIEEEVHEPTEEELYEIEKARLLTAKTQEEYDLYQAELRLLDTSDISIDGANRIQLDIYMPEEIMSDITLLDALYYSKFYINTIIESNRLTNAAEFRFFFDQDRVESPVVVTRWASNADFDTVHFPGDYKDHIITAISYNGEDLAEDLMAETPFSNSVLDESKEYKLTEIQNICENAFSDTVNYINYNQKDNSVLISLKVYDENDIGMNGYRLYMYDKVYTFLQDLQNSSIGNVQLMWYEERPILSDLNEDVTEEDVTEEDVVEENVTKDAAEDIEDDKDVEYEDTLIAYMNFLSSAVDSWDFSVYDSSADFNMIEIINLAEVYKEEDAIDKYPDLKTNPDGTLVVTEDLEDSDTTADDITTDDVGEGDELADDVATDDVVEGDELADDVTNNVSDDDVTTDDATEVDTLPADVATDDDVVSEQEENNTAS